MNARKKSETKNPSEESGEKEDSQRGGESSRGKSKHPLHEGAPVIQKKGFSIERFPSPAKERGSNAKTETKKAADQTAGGQSVTVPKEREAAKETETVPREGLDRTLVLGAELKTGDQQGGGDDKTYQLNPLEEAQNQIPYSVKTGVSVGRQTNPYQVTSNTNSLLGGMMSGSQASLTQAQNLKIAQQKIFELEAEIENLREKNEALGAAGETLKKRNEELRSEKENDESVLRLERDRFEDEKEIFLNSISAKERTISDQTLKLEEYEMRLSSSIHKIRVRERELENRLELIKMEGAALVRNKDEIILNMKREVDQLNMELENYRNKGLDLNNQLADKKETLRRTVRALRLALSMLEGSENINPKKKGE